MRYTEFRELIQTALQDAPDGLTWVQLKQQLDLPHKQPCQTWVYELEADIGLQRDRRRGRALVWQIGPTGDEAANGP